MLKSRFLGLGAWDTEEDHKKEGEGVGLQV